MFSSDLKGTNKNLLSVDSQKGINAVQRCSLENQKGTIAVQSLWQ